MSQADDRIYNATRAEVEQNLAEAATDPAVAAVHRTLAAEYRRRALEQGKIPLQMVRESKEARA